ncbi:putative FAD-binding oxidoreductase [Hypoxylon cercidicola]|nr:putative FAD-binding oxidoreductase [Hypoxylon cercidicola]
MANFTVSRALIVFFFLLGRTSADQLDAAENLCGQLDEGFNSFTYLPGNTLYKELSEENWSQTAWGNPTCIFQPNAASDLQAVVPLLVGANISFAIRSGGHSPSPGGANIDHGVLIDMSRFNDVHYLADENAAVVGSGQTWEHVYTQLDQYNVTVVGGRVLDVGVGGLTLGSGLSYMSDLYGLTCDNVIDFEVVLANGSLVDANMESNPDLFWALKGGANNFGIVTSFKLSAYPIHEVWGGVKGYSLEDLPALLKAALEYQSAPHKDPYANFMMQGFPTNSSFGIIMNIVYLKPEVSPPAFEPFYRINTTSDTTKLRSYTDFLSGQALFDIPRADWRATSFEPDESLYATIENIITESAALKQIQSVTSGSLAFGLQPISTSLVDAGRQRGGNALGLKPVNQTWWVLDSLWWSPEDDELVHNSTRTMVDDIEVAAKSGDKYLPYQFMNDASWDQPVIAHYGEENVRRLWEVQAKYDPDLVFQRLVPGGFKLPLSDTRI